MDVFALVLWLLVAGLALPVGLFTAAYTPVFMVQAMAVGGSAALWVVGVLLGDGGVLFWVAMGLGGVALAALMAGVAGVLHSDESTSEWHEAGMGLAGIEGPLLLVAGIVAIWPALGYGIVS